MTYHKPLPSLERLNELFLLDENSPTGIRRKLSRGNTKRLDVAGSKHSKGYWCVRVDGISYQVHRLVYKMHYKIDPGILQVDHIDKNKKNNKPSNLRLVDNAKNQQNTSLRKNNTTGVKGVHLMRGKYSARIGVNKKRIFLGWFDTLEEAKQAREEAEKLWHNSK